MCWGVQGVGGSVGEGVKKCFVVWGCGKVLGEV